MRRVLEIIGGTLAEELPGCLATLVCLAVAVLVAGALSGCGGVLGAQARTATVALVAVEGVQRSADTGHEADVAACAGSLPCLDAADARWFPVAAMADSIGAALVAWVGALEVAGLAEGGADLDAALSLAMARALELWPAFVEVCRGVGLELPALGGAP